MALVTKRKPKQDKRRNAAHHKKSKDYLKHYLPYLPMLMLAVVALALNSIWSHSGVLGTKSDFSPNALLNYTNAARADNKEMPLSLDAKLSEAAQAKANDLVTKNYWSHTSPDGKTPWNFIVSTGYNYEQAGENLAYGFNSSADVITGWMNSPAHRQNVLNSSYSSVGFGESSASNYLGKGPATVIVAEYAEPSGSVLPATTLNQPTAGTTSISRIQLLTGGNASWSIVGVVGIVSSAITFVSIRYAVKIRKALAKGEKFIIKHPQFDLAMVLIIIVGFILSRTGGFIR